LLTREATTANQSTIQTDYFDDDTSEPNKKVERNSQYSLLYFIDFLKHCFVLKGTQTYRNTNTQKHAKGSEK
jgi:hypothetical protein